MHLRFATMAVDAWAGINESAPVVGRSEVEIAAAPESVWEVLTSFEHWPSWLRDVKSMSMQGPVAVGSVFKWKAGPGTITSTIQRVERPRLIAWTGRTFGIRAIHFWSLEAREAVRSSEPRNRTRVSSAASFADRSRRRSSRARLRALRPKAEVERRLGPASSPAMASPG